MITSNGFFFTIPDAELAHIMSLIKQENAEVKDLVSFYSFES